MFLLHIIKKFLNNYLINSNQLMFLKSSNLKILLRIRFANSNIKSPITENPDFKNFEMIKYNCNNFKSRNFLDDCFPSHEISAK